MQKHEAKQHVKHGWTKRTTDHIKNVAYLDTHYLMACPCGHGGWVEKEIHDSTIQS